MDLKQYFIFNREQRIGLACLIALIVSVQCSYYIIDYFSESPKPLKNEKWMSLQKEIDSIKLKQINKNQQIISFNPNFISDFKGYQLGMSTKEIDRLQEFRKNNKYVNSIHEFQIVTKVSDSLLLKISPLFKFPDWVKRKREQLIAKNTKYSNTYNGIKSKTIIPIDINLASKSDLLKIYGIGEQLSDRILTFKNKVGSFVSMEQMNDIWGISDEVMKELNSHFKIDNTSNIHKLKINTLPLNELSKFPYFNYNIAKKIVSYRSMNNGIKSIDDLTKIKDFPIDKIKIIALYLDFN